MAERARPIRLGVLLSLLGAVGCGGGGAVAGNIIVADDVVPEHVIAGDCMAVDGPLTVAAGMMSFDVVDTPMNVSHDVMEIAIVPHALYAADGCNFAASQAVIDNSNVANESTSTQVGAGSYDFVAACDNAVFVDCFFNLTWRATL